MKRDAGQQGDRALTPFLRDTPGSLRLITSAMSNGSSSKGVLVWAVMASVFLACSMLANLVLFVLLMAAAGSAGPGRLGRDTVLLEKVVGGDRGSRNKIAVIPVNGLISYSVSGATGEEGMVGDIKEQLRIATEDEHVKAIVLAVDSPGGEVTAADDIYRAVVRARERKQHVVVSMGSLAASGGYYVSVGGEHIMAADSTITGSIGVILQSLNYRELLEKVGLQVVTVKSGKFKDLLSGSREPTTEEMDLVQRLILEAYDQFVEVVARERNRDVQELKAGVADGRIFSGRQALQEGLVDSLGYFEDAVEKAKEMAGIADARLVKYVAPMTLRRLLEFLGHTEARPLKVELGPPTLKLENGKLYYVAEQFLR